jgi:hypothetical protein
MGDRNAEKIIFEAFLGSKPDFAGEAIGSWEQPDQDPPDILCLTASGRRIGVELGEWLNEEQIREAKGSEAIQDSILTAIGPQPTNDTENIYFAWLHPRPKARVKPADVPAFRSEILDLVREVDTRWESEPFWQSPQGCQYQEFAAYPAVGKYLRYVRFFPRLHYVGWPPQGQMEKRTWPEKCDWLIFPARGGAYSKEPMVNALLSIITKKIEKYEAKPPTVPLDEFHLLIHYNQAWVYNTPVETPFFKYKDAARAAVESVGDDSGPFSRIFLFLALRPGEEIFQLFPR